MNDPLIVAAFDESLPQLRTNLGGDDLQLARVRQTDPGGTVEMVATPEDAFALIVQLQPLPAHSLSYDGRLTEVAAGPAHAVSVFDLAGDAGARIAHRFDSLHFRVPRTALDQFADRAGTPRVSRLHVPGIPFATIDTLIGDLSRPLVGAMALQREAPLFGEHLLLSLMAHITTRYGDGRGQLALAAGGLSPWQERRAKAMLDAIGDDKPTLSDVASACGISVAHFSRAFKRTVGLPPWVWHQRRRVEQAQTLLRDFSLPLAQVAIAAGFADQSHFTRVFGRQVGISPGQWRRERGIH